MKYLALFLLSLILSCYRGAPPPIPLDPVRFLSINDVQVADTLPNGLGGLARVATVRHRLADQGPGSLCTGRKRAGVRRKADGGVLNAGQTGLRHVRGA